MWNNKNLIKTLLTGGVAVMPTDTIYGIVGRAQDINTVNRIYTLRGRDLKKPCIILIGDIKELDKFSITLSAQQKKIIQEKWYLNKRLDLNYRATSIVLDCPFNSLAYLHRGANTLAFRLPVLSELRALLLKTGPLVAPSANKTGYPPSSNITDAEKYFKNSVDLYIDAGEIKGQASSVVRLDSDGFISIIRP